MKTTREGKRFLLATFLIGVAAINTGNNLIYLILSLMISFLFLAFFLLRINLAGLSLSISMNQPVFAGEVSSAIFSLTNRKRFVPTYSVYVKTDAARSSAYCALIPSRGTLRRELKLRFERRGIYRYGNFEIQSGFPFILFTGEVTVKVLGELIVYPSFMDIDSLIPDIAGHEHSGPMQTIGRGEEMHSIRELRYGDDWRRIHWKVSAKSSRLFVKEYAEHAFRKVTVIIDNLFPEDPERFEKVVSLTGSLCRHFLDMGYHVRGISCGKVIPFGTGEEQLFKILDILAVIREEELWDCPITSDGEGYCVLVLKSHTSSLRRHVSQSHGVIYADTL